MLAWSDSFRRYARYSSGQVRVSIHSLVLVTGFQQEAIGQAATVATGDFVPASIIRFQFSVDGIGEINHSIGCNQIVALSPPDRY